jgi:hypothetical protein
MNSDQLKTAATGLIGSATSIGAAVYSMLPHLEAWMRLASVAVGLAVGIVTLVKILRDLKK